MSSYRYLIVSGAGSIDWQLFGDATDEKCETTISVVPSYDKNKVKQSFSNDREHGRLTAFFKELK